LLDAGRQGRWLFCAALFVADVSSRLRHVRVSALRCTSSPWAAATEGVSFPNLRGVPLSVLVASVGCSTWRMLWKDEVRSLRGCSPLLLTRSPI